MEIYLLRHAIAEENSPSGRDADRRLTEKGCDKLRRVLKRAAAAEVEPSLILTSPLVRAVQTAEIAAQVLKCKEKILHTEALLPGSSPRDVWDELRNHKDETAVLLAGHEPLFSITTAFLLGSNRQMVDFKKAGLVRIDVTSLGPSPAGVLKWLITPDVA